MRRLQRLHKDTLWQFLEREALRLSREITEECVNWPHSMSDGGYGRVKRGDKTYRVHRYAYAVVSGIDLAAIEDLVVRHSCDNPACFNPRHLLIGTHKDNSHDRESRGRSNPVRGAASSMAKLDEDGVQEIRKLLASGISQARIGLMFGVSASTVGLIKRQKNWRHLAPPEGVDHESFARA